MGKVISWELCKKLKLDLTTKWYVLKTESVLEKETHKILRDFEITKQLISARKAEPVIIKYRACCIVDFTVPEDHRVKIKENEKRGKYLDLTRELRKLRNMKATEIPIVIGTLETVPEGFEGGLKESENRKPIETIQMTALLGSARIFSRVLVTRRDLLSFEILRITSS